MWSFISALVLAAESWAEPRRPHWRSGKEKKNKSNIMQKETQDSLENVVVKT